MRDGKSGAATAVEMQDDYDWIEAWGYGGGDPGTEAIRSQDGPSKPFVCDGAGCSDNPVDASDLARVVASSEGENDVSTWVAVALLSDGRYAFLEAGCDYTGWDCQAGGRVWVSDTLENLWQFGVTQAARDRLGDAPPAQWVDA